MNWIAVEHNGKKLRVPALKYQGRLWFHLDGQTHVVELQSGTRKSGGDRGKTHPGIIQAPMPGKVTRVNVKKADTVQKGQALVVMEAMKMEYTLESDRNGVVLEIGAKVGVQVGLGDVLVRVGDS